MGIDIDSKYEFVFIACSVSAQTIIHEFKGHQLTIKAFYSIVSAQGTHFTPAL